MRIHSPMKEVTIHYMESVMGSNTSQTWLTCKSGDVIVVDEIGVVEIKAYATKEGFFRSALAVKKYKIIDRCEIPKIIPNGGTHAGSVLINFSSSTLNAIYCYRISKILTTSKKMDNDDDFTCLDGGISSFQLSGVGIYEVDVFAKKDNFAASPVAKAKFTLGTVHMLPFTFFALITKLCFSRCRGEGRYPSNWPRSRHIYHLRAVIRALLNA